VGMGGVARAAGGWVVVGKIFKNSEMVAQEV